jgi:hypothetical protein
VRSHLKNRSGRKPQYPNAVGNPRPSGRGGCQFTKGLESVALVPGIGFDPVDDLTNITSRTGIVTQRAGRFRKMSRAIPRC